MKINELKERAYLAWERLCEANDAVIQPEAFKPEVRKLGDMRRRSTWERAIARFTAWWYIDTCLEAWVLVAYQLNFNPGDWTYEFRFLILEELMTHPTGMQLIKAGLEQIFSSPSDFEEETENAKGLLTMVGSKAEGRTFVGQSDGLVRELHQLAGASRT